MQLLLHTSQNIARSMKEIIKTDYTGLIFEKH